MGRRQHAPVDPDTAPVYIPAPPSDDEKYSYFQKPKQWIFAWIFVSALGILYGYVMVAIKSPLTTPALLVLPIMVMPVLVNFWLRSHRPRLTLEQHQKVLSQYRPDPADTVDIWVPICGEPIPVLRNTCRTVAALQWHAPVMRYLLDDGDPRPEVEAMALEFGFVYVRRRDAPPGREPREGERGWLKKAGNMINAFELSMGRFGVVFDADFAPRPDFLKETVPYMQVYPRTGIVQTAQYFDISPWMNYVQRGAGSLQEVFFRWIQPARDVWRAAICAGTNVVYRRDAVESVGGFARVPLGEDVNSGVKLWTGGWETRYLPLALAKGVAPDTWSAITNQQQRWCRSSMLLMTEKHFRDAKFNWQQRMAFWAAFFYYMASAGLLLTAPFPTLTMLWFFPDQVLPHNYLPMIPALLATLLIFPIMARGWRPEIFRLCMINSACHVIAIGDALRAKVQEWVPTGAVSKQPKAKKKGAPERVSRLLRSWVVIVQLLLWSGLALRLPEYGIGTLWTTALLAAVQLWFVAPLLLPSYGIRDATPPIEVTDRGAAVAEAERAWNAMRFAAPARSMAPAAPQARPMMPAQQTRSMAAAAPQARPMAPAPQARPVVGAAPQARPVVPAQQARSMAPAQAAAQPAGRPAAAEPARWGSDVAPAADPWQEPAPHGEGWGARGSGRAHDVQPAAAPTPARQGTAAGHAQPAAAQAPGWQGGAAGQARPAAAQAPGWQGGAAGQARPAAAQAPGWQGAAAGHVQSAAAEGSAWQGGGAAGHAQSAAQAPAWQGGAAGHAQPAAAEGSAWQGAAAGHAQPAAQAPAWQGGAAGHAQPAATEGSAWQSAAAGHAQPARQDAYPQASRQVQPQRGQHAGHPGYQHGNGNGQAHSGGHVQQQPGARSAHQQPGVHSGHQQPAAPAHGGSAPARPAPDWQRGPTRLPAQRRPHDGSTYPDPHQTDPHQTDPHQTDPHQPEPPHQMERAW